MRLNPGRAAEIHLNDTYRLRRALELSLLCGSTPDSQPPRESRRGEALVIHCHVERTELRERIHRRLATMLCSGFIEEVEGLLQQGVLPTCKAMQSIGYRHVVQYLHGGLRKEEMRDKIITATCQFAKRQRTWWRNVSADIIVSSDKTSNLLQEIQRTLHM